MRDRAVAALEKGIAENRISAADLNDRNYRPIAGSSPPKFSTAFDKFFDQVICPIQEEVLAKQGTVFFAICVDENGYVASHNLRYTKPLTGDPETDKINNRTKRIFNDKTGLKAAQNTEPFLMQTYMRDTGEIMNDLSTPITINNRHWGAVHIGYKAE